MLKKVIFVLPIILISSVVLFFVCLNIKSYIDNVKQPKKKSTFIQESQFIYCKTPTLNLLKPSDQNYTTKSLKIGFLHPLPYLELRQAIIDAIEQRPKQIFKENHQINITSARIEFNWVIASVGAYDGKCYSLEAPYSGEECTSIIIARTDDCIKWEAAILGTELFQKLVKEAPNKFITTKAKNIFLQINSKQLNKKSI